RQRSGAPCAAAGKYAIPERQSAYIMIGWYADRRSSCGVQAGNACAVPPQHLAGLLIDHQSAQGERSGAADGIAHRYVDRTVRAFAEGMQMVPGLSEGIFQFAGGDGGVFAKSC